MAGGGCSSLEAETPENPSFLFPSVLLDQKQATECTPGENEKVSIKLSGFSSFRDVNSSCQRSESKALDTHKSCPSVPALVDCLDNNSEEEVDHLENKKRKLSSSDTDSNNRRNKKKKKKEKKKKEKKKKKKHHHNVDKKVSYDKNKPDTIWLEETALKIEEAFRFDKRECKENLQFDTFYRLDIANYKRRSEIVCLGLRKNQYFEWTDQRSTKKRLKNGSVKKRYFTALKQERITANIDIEHEQQITIHNNEENNQSTLEDAKHPPKSLKDNQECQAHTFSQKTEYLNRSLRNNPKDIDLWIQLVKLQDEAFQNKNELDISSTFNAQTTKNTSHRAIVEKKIQILDRALSSNPDSLLLIIEYMESCREILDFTQVNNKWTNFTFKNPNKGILWGKYLMFLQSDLSNFSTSAVISAYHKCFKTMQAIADDTIKTHKCEDDHVSNMICIFIQYCQFLHQSDLPEKAVASMQAMIEFNCFTPKDLDKVPASGQKAFFEAFLDSEVPRFGEEMAEGWESWMHAQKNQVVDEMVAHREVMGAQVCVDEDNDASRENVDRTQMKSVNWLMIECQRQYRLWKPLRQSEDSEDYVDPDRVVLADDILPCLFKLQSEEDRLSMLLFHLSFLGIPVKKEFLSSSCWKKLSEFGFTPKFLKIFSNTVGAEFVCLYSPVSFEISSNNATKLEEHRISYVEEVFLQSLKLAGRYSQQFSNTVSQGLLLFKILCIKNLYEDSRGIKDAVKKTRKFGRSLLKQTANRNCLELWQIFAYFEHNFGNHEEAFRILDMVIAMCMAEEPKDASKFSWIFRSYAMFLMQSVEHGTEGAGQIENKIVNLLLLLGQDPSTSSSSISNEKANPLRIRRIKEGFKESFTRILDDARSQQPNRGSMRHKLKQEKFEWILCFAMIVYFTESIEAFNSVLEELQSNIQLDEEKSLELTHFKLAVLQYSCIKLRTNLPKLREALWDAVERFPSDLMLNEKLLEVENKSITSLKIRRHHHRILANAESLLLWLFAINYEEQRLKTLKLSILLDDIGCLDKTTAASDTVFTTLPNAGIINRIRSLYDRATSSREGRSSVPLWRRFFQFEVKNGDSRRSKNVFYAAIQNCPWSKEIYLDAINVHGDEFENILDIMQEKEIRVRLPVEELKIMLEE